MNLVSIFAELQINPCSISAYRRLAEHYNSCNRQHEAEAIEALIKERLNGDHSHINQEQRADNPENT